MICFAVSIEVEERHWDEVRRVLAELTEQSRREPGCLAYCTQQSQGDRRRFYIFERYRDPAALEAHRASQHYQRLAAGRLYKLITGEKRVENFDVIA